MMKATKTGRIIVAGALVLAGCAAPGGTTVPQMTQVNYYPQCYQSVGLLRQQDQQFQQVMAVNTLAGAAGGAALGAHRQRRRLARRADRGGCRRVGRCEHDLRIGEDAARGKRRTPPIADRQ